MATKRKQKAAKPADMETRLSNAYSAGYFDGWVEASQTTHAIWVEISQTTKGMGPVMQKRFIDRAFEVMRERSSDKFGKPPQDVEDAREELQNNVTEELG